MQNIFAKSLVMCSIMTVGAFAFGATPVEVVAPQTNVNMFVNSSGVAIPTGSYTSGTHPIYGNVQFLRSGSPGYSSGATTVQQRLQSTSYASGKIFDSYTFAGVAHQRAYESGFTGQCVGFAKFMTGAPGGISTWRKGRALTAIFPSGQTVSGAANTLLVPGSMIAHFGGKSIYSDNTTNNPHVAIVLSVSEVNGVIQGINVVDQNGLTSATINGVSTSVVVNAGNNVTYGTIAKHFLPWSSSSTNPVLSGKNYHVVAQCPTGQTCPWFNTKINSFLLIL